MIGEDAEAAAFFAKNERPLVRPEDAHWPDWSGSLYRAWSILRDDRHYGAMGGLGRIYYRAISAYAADHGIDGDEFTDFLTFVIAMDDEYVAFANEKQKAESDRHKSESKR